MLPTSHHQHLLKPSQNLKTNLVHDHIPCQSLMEITVAAITEVVEIEIEAHEAMFVAIMVLAEEVVLVVVVVVEDKLTLIFQKVPF